MSTFLAERFEQNRPHLRAVAFRILGSASEADDAVQEAWLRLSRSQDTAIENLGAWLRTVVARVCLDMLRSRRTHREEPMDEQPWEEPIDDEIDPERDAVLADSISSALVIVLDRLTPAERVAFVLHDMFDLSFDEIAPIVGRSATAARQLASRARRRVRGGSSDGGADRARQREVVEAFLAASRSGNLAQLVALLDPDIVLRADRPAVESAAARQDRGAPKLAPEIRGARQVADALLGRASAARPATINGDAGLVWAPGGHPRAVFRFAIRDGRVAAIDIATDPEYLRDLEIVMDDSPYS